MSRILLVEDDARIRTEVVGALARAGFVVESAQRLADARSKGPDNYDLLLLDLGLPDGNGLELCRELRRNGHTRPILMLTARDAPEARVLGLDSGADDYLIKPFHLAELVARVRSLLRRTGETEAVTHYSAGELWLDTARREAGMGEAEIALRRREFDLLAFLMRHPRRPWSREQLLERVWGPDFTGDARTVDIHVRRLRQKIELDAARPVRIVTEFGIGYRFCP